MSNIQGEPGIVKTGLPAVTADDTPVALLTDDRKRLRLSVEDTTTNSANTQEVDPLSAMHLEENLATLTAIASGVTGNLYVDLNGYRYDVVQLTIGGTDSVTCTLWGTVQTGPIAARTYQDITLAYAGVASIAVTGMFILDTPSPFTAIMIEYVTAGGAGDGALTVDNKKMF